MKWVVLAVVALMYLLVIIFNKHKSWFSLGASLLFLILGVVGLGETFTHLINWNVLLIYIGSLIIAELFIYSRVPAYLADMVIDKTPSLGLGMVIILVITGILSAFVENVATVLVMAPIAIEISRRLKLNPTAFMVGLAVMANLQGTATLVGDPPSMIFAGYAGYSFNDFFFFAGRPSIFFAVEIAALAGAIFFLFQFKAVAKVHVDIPKEKVKSLFPSILLILLVAGLAVISFFFEGFSIVSGICCMGLGIVGLLWFIFVRRKGSKEGFKLIASLDWDTILFLIGIFIAIGAVSKVGLLDDLSTLLSNLAGDHVLLGFLLIIGVSVVLSGFIDNVPYILVMLPIVGNLSHSMGLRPELYMFALLIASCMGGNLTPFGASANVVTLGLVKKEGYRVGFADWLKIGLPFTLITTAVASIFVWFVWK